MVSQGYSPNPRLLVVVLLVVVVLRLVQLRVLLLLALPQAPLNLQVETPDLLSFLL